MARRCVAVLAAICAMFPPLWARAETIIVCTAVADAATGEVLTQEGACDTRATPASTFKIAISLMAFDAGFLKDVHTPALPFRQGYADWIPTWRSTTDPARWMAESVVWYSRLATEAIGKERFGRYVDAFDYGNRNVSGDPGRDNGLTDAWLSSSLEISPLEQLAFLREGRPAGNAGQFARLRDDSRPRRCRLSAERLARLREDRLRPIEKSRWVRRFRPAVGLVRGLGDTGRADGGVRPTDTGYRSPGGSRRTRRTRGGPARPILDARQLLGTADVGSGSQAELQIGT